MLFTGLRVCPVFTRLNIEKKDLLLLCILLPKTLGHCNLVSVIIVYWSVMFEIIKNQIYKHQFEDENCF